MIRLFKSLAAKIWALSLVALILFGLLLGLVRLGLPLIEGYRAEVQARASEYLGAPIRLGSILARLSGFTPELLLKDVKVLSADGTQTLLGLRQVHMEIDLRASWQAGATRFGLIRVEGAKLLIRRSQDGRISLAGLGNGEGPPPTDGGLWLADGQFRLQDSEVVWVDDAAALPRVPLVKVDARLTNDGHKHQLDIQAELAGQPGGSFHLALDAHGRHHQLEHWQAKFYLRVAGLPLETALSRHLPQPLPDFGGTLDLELWGEANPHAIQRLWGDFDWRQPHLAVKEAAATPPWSADRLQGQFRWLTTEDGRLALEGRDWSLRRGAELQQFIHSLRLDWSSAAEGTEIEASLDRLDLGEAATLVRPFLGEQGWPLSGRRPRGTMKNVRLGLSLKEGGISSWKLGGEVLGLSLPPSGKGPGLQGLDLEFFLGPEKGTASLRSSDLLVELPHLFRGPLRAKDCRGTLDWQRTATGGWSLSSEDLLADNEDIHSRTRFQLELPGNEQSPFLDLQTDFHDGNAAVAGRYYPVGIMPKDVVAWLDRAILGGRVTSGSALFRGRLKDFPFPRDEGRFEVLFGVEKVVLDYQEGWPRLEDVSAEVRFLNNSLNIKTGSATLLASRIKEGTSVEIRQLNPTSPLEIRGGTSGPFADSFRILIETPLAEHFAEDVSGLRPRGKAAVDLQLSIPLSHHGETKVNGKLSWSDAGLDIPAAGLELNAIKGSLQISQDGLAASGIEAKALGEKVRLDIATQTEEPGFTRIAAVTSLGLANLKDRYPGFGLDLLEGRSDWQLTMTIPHHKPGQARGSRQLSLQSDLRGTKVDLPPPFGKTAATAKPIRLGAELGANQELRLDLAYGQELQARLLLAQNNAKGWELQRGAVQLGGQEAPSPSQSGLWLAGELEQLDLLAWGRLLGRGKGAKGPPSAGPLRELDLHIGHLTLGEFESLRQARLRIRRAPEAWIGSLQADGAKASLYLPQDPAGGRLAIELDRIDLKLDPAASDADTAPASDQGEADPRDWPALALRVRELALNGHHLGPLVLETRREREGLDIERLSLGGQLLKLNGDGSWRVQGRRTRTQVRLSAQSPDLGRLLKDSHLTANYEQGRGEGSADLAWDGSPWEPKLESLQGSARFKIEKGAFAEVDPGMGRLFGLINLAAVQRRLLLDFSDLFRKGLAYDHIQGSFRLQGGQATTADTQVKGPAASISISGRTGLKTRDYDQTMTVIPHVSTGLPVAAVLAGGPVAGAAALVAQQLVGDEIDKIGQRRYRVTGSWDAPEIQRLTE